MYSKFNICIITYFSTTEHEVHEEMPNSCEISCQTDKGNSTNIQLLKDHISFSWKQIQQIFLTEVGNNCGQSMIVQLLKKSSRVVHNF